MLEVEIVDAPPGAPDADDVRRLCAIALASAGVEDGHIAISYVDADAIAALNREHRGKDAPTDVLSFPIDGAAPATGPRELGDIVICAAQTRDLREAVVHGALHLVGMDHESDDGEMLTLQRELLAWEARPQ
jgi:probable rRNA maturation factor